VVVDSHHFDEEQDPDPDPHYSEKLGIRVEVKTGSGSAIMPKIRYLQGADNKLGQFLSQDI
jgi:hypothetical protein